MGDFFNKIKQMWNTPDDEYDYDDKDEEKSRGSQADDDYYYDESDTGDSYAPSSYSGSGIISDDSYSSTSYSGAFPWETTPASPPVVPQTITEVDSVNSEENEMEQESTKLEVVVFEPDRFSNETREIADELIKGHTIVLGLEKADKDNSRRIIDFMSGAAYAAGGKIKRAAASKFVIIPKSVNISGDELLNQLEESGVL